MFRGITKSVIDPNHFGAGSIMRFGPGESYLVVSHSSKWVSLVRLETFECINSPCNVQVEDVNHLSQDEARELVSKVVKGMAFTDGEYDSKGLKKSI